MNDRLKSKVNIPYVSLILLTFIIASVYPGTTSTLLVIELLNNGTPFFEPPFNFPLLIPLCFVLFFSLFLFYIVRYIIGSIPTWKIDREGIAISGLLKSNTYAWHEITGIELSGKRPKKFLGIPFPEETLTIQLIDGTETHLWLRL